MFFLHMILELQRMKQQKGIMNIKVSVKSIMIWYNWASLGRRLRAVAYQMKMVLKTVFNITAAAAVVSFISWTNKQTA